MSIKGSELALMAERKIAALFQTEKCPVCNNPVDPDTIYSINNKPVHKNCYYSELSREIDKYPIHHPGMHR